MESRAQAIAAQVQRAKDAHNRTGALRKETLGVLMRATRSASSALKSLAAENIQYFLQDFPDLEEQAINAVYDLCEDQDQQIRIQGYKAISRISRIENRLVKRNADVLLQLLQSDEPEEVKVVKSALLEHLEMDPKGTLGVLYDQLTSVDNDMDEDERSMRERLRYLVSAFLTDEALQPIARLSRTDATLEPEFLQHLLGVVPYLSFREAQDVVGKLVDGLPFPQTPSHQGEDLLRVLLARAVAALEFPDRISNELDLAQHLVLDRRIASPLELLRHYSRHFTKRLSMQGLAQPDQERLLGKLAAVLTFVQRGPSDQEMLQAQWAIVDDCPYLLECLIPTMMDSSSATCATLLRTCLLRKNSTPGWAVPPVLVSVLQKMKKVADKAPPQETKREFQKMLMFLLPAATASSTTERKSTGRVMKTATRSTSDAKSTARVIQAATRSVPVKPAMIHDDITGNSRSIRSEAGESQANGSRPAKKRKGFNEKDSEEPPQAKLSLLSRLQTPVSTPKSATSRSATPSAPTPAQGFSIKGAASASSKGSAPSTQKSSLSLLERLQGTSQAISGSPMDIDNQASMGHRKRKRGHR